MAQNQNHSIMDIMSTPCDEHGQFLQHDQIVYLQQGSGSRETYSDSPLELASLIRSRPLDSMRKDDGPHIYQPNEAIIDVDTSLLLYARKIGSISPPDHFAALPSDSSTSSAILRPSPCGECQGLPYMNTSRSKNAICSFRHQLFSCMNGTQPMSGPMLQNLQARSSPFEISRTNPQAKSNINHYQLRNRLVVTSRHHAYYSSKTKVLHVDPSCPAESIETPRPAMDLSCLSQKSPTAAHISTINKVLDSILIAGTFGGQFAYISLDQEPSSSLSVAIGQAAEDRIINYIDSTSCSPSGPTAVISCNDHNKTLAFVDCHRNEVYQTFNFQKSISHLPCPERAIVNCTATSSDGRIRILVGDFTSILVTDARSGKVIHEMENSHNDDGTFACAWSPTGPIFATGGEDKCVRIWDARTWTATAELATFTAPVRNLSFSPLGQGPPTLFAGEALDYVHVLNVGSSSDMFWTRERTRTSVCEQDTAAQQEWHPDGQVPGRLQLLHHLGDNAGMAVSPDGGELMLANGDVKYGGLMIWERTSWSRPSHGRMERGPRYSLPEHSDICDGDDYKRRRV